MEEDNSHQKEKQNLFQKIFIQKWHPNPTEIHMIIFFSTLAAFSLILAIVTFSYNAEIVECCSELEHYEFTCSNQMDCNIDFQIVQEMKQPVYLFYNLENYHQNHRNYLKSKSLLQLAGDEITMDKAEKKCEPVVKNSDLDIKVAWDNVTALNQDEVANPCGLIAKSVFNDSYSIFQQQDKDQYSQINISETDIAWPDDKGDKFKRINGDQEQSQSLQWIDPQNEHFIVWMRTSGLPNFKKLWGRIENDLPVGKYKIQINNIYNVSGIEGRKTILLSTAKPFGGQNLFMAVAYIVSFAVCSIIGIGFTVLSIKNKKKAN